MHCLQAVRKIKTTAGSESISVGSRCKWRHKSPCKSTSVGCVTDAKKSRHNKYGLYRYKTAVVSSRRIYELCIPCLECGQCESLSTTLSSYRVVGHHKSKYFLFVLLMGKRRGEKSLAKEPRHFELSVTRRCSVCYK